jgi:hypothetical protein
MNVAAQVEHNTGLPARPELASREARRWIQRQLSWERTLESLRRGRHEDRKAA